MQAIKLLKIWAVVEISTYIIMLLDNLQDIKSSSSQVITRKSQNIKVSNCFYIRLSSIDYIIFVIKILFQYGILLQY